MPGVGSTPIPKSGIQPRLMGGRTKQNKLPRELTDRFCDQKEPRRSKTTVSEKEEQYCKGKIITQTCQKTWISRKQIKGCQITIVAAAAAKSLQSCLTLCDPIDGSPPGSPVPGILQTRTLEWVAISFSSA